MRKNLIIMLLSAVMFLVLTSFSLAQTEFKTVFTPSTSLPINLNGDTAYRIKARSFDAGIGIDLASYKGIVNIRAETTQSSSGSPFVGAGLMLNLPALINQLGAKYGTNWIEKTINPSIGFVPGYDFGTKKFDLAIVLSIISVTF